MLVHASMVGQQVLKLVGGTFCDCIFRKSQLPSQVLVATITQDWAGGAEVA